MKQTNRNIVLLLGLLLALLLVPLLVANSYYMHLVNLILVYSMITVGLNLITGVTGQVSLGHAAFWGIGAYVAAFVTTRLELSFWLAVPLALIVTGLIGFIVGYFTLHLEGPYLAMATIGIGEITHQVLINWEAFSGGPSGIYGIPSISIGGFTIDSEGKFYYFAFISLLFVYLLCRWIVSSRMGRTLIAIREQEGAAKAVGVDTTRMKVYAFTISTVIAGGAGSIHAHWINYISPEMFSFAESLLFLTMIMVGGLGSLPASIIGTAALVFLSELLRDIEQFRMIIYAALLFIVIMFFPEGMIGMLPKRWRKGKAYPDDGPDGQTNLFTQELGSKEKGTGELLLRTTGVTKVFGGLKAVHEVDFELKKGEIHALIGPNGSGKTTFLNCLAGWYETDGGKIELEGADITSLPIHKRARQGIARTFQNILLFNSMTVLENILVALDGKGKSEKQLVQSTYELLRFVGLTQVAHETVSNLSYGVQRRVEMARALALKPRLLLLDEPAAGMNDSETTELMNLIYRIRELGITVLIVEHDMRLVMGIAERITVLNQGKKLAEGSPVEIRTHPEVIAAYLGRGAQDVIGL